uniref:ELMO domain-containing protein n=1 Tax=Aureoumbra lagunensis TaxID=44058 RepID=A0A7S3JS69_9STRA|mmetsp:Transcript_13772/g.20566  ORF Transcript_13772/g.20566 Transcript_13772/m.20566 type:complete len:572 (+) Transcript_13772:53-1768(+)
MLRSLKKLLNNAQDNEEELSDGARARQEVLRCLLRRPIQIGEEEYESLLGEVYEMAEELLESAPLKKEKIENDTARHRQKGARWDEMGFQANAPDREFRGGGMLGLHCLHFALKKTPNICKQIIRGPFPFAAASINMTLVVARLCGVARPGSADEDAVDPLAEVGEGSKSMANRCQKLLEDSHDGFFLVHCAALEALERARFDVDAGPMDFAACAAAARDEVAVLLSHQPSSGEALQNIAHQIPKRVSGFLIILTAIPSTQMLDEDDIDNIERKHSAHNSAHNVISEKASSSGFGAILTAIHSSSTSGIGKISRKGNYYVSLSTGILKWYDEVHSHFGRTNSKVAIPLAAPLGTLRLRPSMTIKFNRPNKTLSIYSLREPIKPLFSAIALDATDMERWCVALTEHVALGGALRDGKLAKGATQKPTLTDDDLQPDQRYFKVIETIGIYVRSAPDIAATRTGHALMPGDLVYATKRIRVQDERAGPHGRSFLQIVLNSPFIGATTNNNNDLSSSVAIGFVMEHHPQTFAPIMLQVDPPPTSSVSSVTKNMSDEEEESRKNHLDYCNASDVHT